MSIGIYKITSPSNKSYIGQSWNIEKRFKTYMGLYCKSQRKLYASLNKYGSDNHIFEILLELPLETTQEILDEKEIYYINHNVNLGIELMNIRGGGSRGKISYETKEKMSKARKGKMSEEDKEKMSKRQSGCGNGMYGKTPWNKGKSMSVECREKISNSTSGKINTKNRKKVLQFSLEGIFIKEWLCIKLAAKELGITRPHISSCCSGKRNSCGGFIWKYKID